MSLIDIAIRGDLEKYQREEIDLKKKADLYALKVGSEKLRAALAGQTTSSLGDRLGKSWKARTYPNGGQNPTALVYTKAPDIISAFMAQTVILPKKGRYLAIPTNFNRSEGRRGAKVRVTPKEMVASNAAFTRPRKNGPGLIWFLTVTRAQHRGQGKTGRVKDMAFAGGLVQVGRFGRRTREILTARAVPMFILVPSVTLTKRLDGDAEASKVRDQLPQLIAEGYSFYDTGGSQ